MSRFVRHRPGGIYGPGMVAGLTEKTAGNVPSSGLIERQGKGFPHGRSARPVKIVNDAAMQALGSYRGGKMLFLGLGTGLGTAVVWDGTLEPMELGHLHYKKGRTFEGYLGLRGLDRLGKKKWRESVADVVKRLKKAFGVDEVVLGGGHAKLLEEAPPGARLGDNANAFAGGFSLWANDPGRGVRSVIGQ